MLGRLGASGRAERLAPFAVSLAASAAGGAKPNAECDPAVLQPAILVQSYAVQARDRAKTGPRA